MNYLVRYALVRPVRAPEYATDGSSGLDFFVPDDEPVKHLSSLENYLVGSGVVVELPPGVALLFVNKSGMAKKGLLVGACLVDSDYRGEIHLHLRNVGKGDYVVRPGDKIMQAIVLEAPQVRLLKVDSPSLFPSTKRGNGSFGSTGSR